MKKHTLLIPVVILSAVLFTACDDNGNDDLGTNTTGVTTGMTGATGTNGMTGSTGTNGMTGTTGTSGIPGTDGEDERIRVSISDTGVTVQPEMSAGENVVLEVTNSSAIDRDILVIRLGADDNSSSLFGLFSNDDAVERAGLDVVEEATVDANSDHEITSDLEAGNYVILATNAQGSEMLWADFSVRESSAASTN